QLQYSIPMSFTTVNVDRWNALDAPTREAIEASAADTQARQWRALEGRVEQNYARMREHGMTIVTEVAPDVRAALRTAARPEGAELRGDGVPVLGLLVDRAADALADRRRLAHRRRAELAHQRIGQHPVTRRPGDRGDRVHGHVAPELVPDVVAHVARVGGVE